MSIQKTYPGCAIAFNIAIAGIVALVGAFIVLISLKVFPGRHTTLYAPRLVVRRPRRAFLLVGGWMAFKTASPPAPDTRLDQWRQCILLLAFMIAFVSVHLWVGLDPGERQFGSLANAGAVNDLIGGLFAAAFCLRLGPDLMPSYTDAGCWPGKRPENPSRRDLPILEVNGTGRRDG
jgi:hypothetical protein